MGQKPAKQKTQKEGWPGTLKRFLGQNSGRDRKMRDYSQKGDYRIKWPRIKLLGVEDLSKSAGAGEDHQYRCNFGIAKDEGGEEEDEHGSIL